MSQRDLVAELQAARVTAPPEVRERVRLIAAGAPQAPRRFTWRRALVVAVPVAAAIAAAVVFSRPSHEPVAVQDQKGAVRAAAPPARAQGAATELSVPSAKARVQVYGATLGLRVHDVSDAVKRATRIVTSLGGYATSVHAQTHGRSGSADLTLKVPRARVQEALARLSALGTITSERVDVTDKQAGLNATDRLIARLQKQLAALRAQHADQRRIDALTKRIERLQRAEAQTRRNAHYATVRLHLRTPAPAAAKSGHGPLHGIGVALEWLGIGAAYALAIGAPVALVAGLVWLAFRTVRRRREDALLSRS